MARNPVIPEHLKGVPFPTEIIDEQLLRQLARSSVERWLAQNSSEISFAAIQRMREGLEFSERSRFITESDTPYIPETEYNKGITELADKTRKTLSRPVVTAAAMAYYHSGLSCHSLLLGKDKPATISQKVSAPRLIMPPQ